MRKSISKTTTISRKIGAQQLQIEGVRGATGWPQRHPHTHAEAVEHGAAHHQIPEEQLLGEPAEIETSPDLTRKIPREIGNWQEYGLENGPTKTPKKSVIDGHMLSYTVLDVGQTPGIDPGVHIKMSVS